MKKIITLSIIAAVYFFTGCEKTEEPNQGNVLKTVNQHGMRVFTDFDELSAEIDKTLAFSLRDLDTYETSINFNSFGKLADKAMEPILNNVALQQLNNPILARISVQSSPFLQIITLDTAECCETKYFQSPFRYVMNTNCMFQVDTIYFKVFEGGHVTCNTQYYNEISTLTENDFSVLEDADEIFTVYRYPDAAKGNYGLGVESMTQSGSDRVYVRLAFLPIWTMPAGYNLTRVMGTFYARTWAYHKCLGIWWKSHRTYSQNITGKLYINNGIRTGSVSGTKLGYEINQTIFNINEVVPYPPVIYVYGGSGWGKIPSLTCYVNWP